MQFATLPHVESELFVLRHLAPGDLEIWSRYLNDPLVYEHTSWNFPTVEYLSAFLLNEQSHEPNAPLRLAIAQKKDDKLMGTIGFHSVSDMNKLAELAFDLHPQYWGSGVIHEAASTLVRWAHESAGIMRVQATVLESNSRSLKTIARLGFQQEGLLRSFRQVRGVARDFYMHSHLSCNPANP